MVNANFLSRRKMTEEIERLQRDNRRLIEGGRPSAAAALIVAELAKLVPSKDIKALETGETFVAYWRKVLEERSEALKPEAQGNVKSRAEAAEQEAARYREMWEQNAAAANAAVQEKLTLEERLSELAQEAVKVVEHADDEDWRRLFTMIDDSGHGRFWKEVLSDWRTFLSKLKGSMS